MHETARDMKAELDSKLSGLQALVIMARQEAERLENAIERAEVACIEAPRDTLARLEGLANPAALADSERLSAAATQLPPLPGGAAAHLFDDNEQSVAVARLADQGHAPSEIARRLGMAVGDVEICLSIRGKEVSRG
jgi:hypothetical protein